MLRRKIAGALCTALILVSALAPARSETTKVRIGLQYGLVYLPIVVAEAEGLFKKQAQQLGLSDFEVTLNRLSGSTAINEALLSKSVDFGAFGLPGLLIAWDKTRGRQHVKGIAGLSTINYYLYANKPGIRSLSDFTDQDKIAVPAFNSPQAILLRVAAERLLGSASKADALMVSLPHPEATNALLAGQAISGYFSTPPFSQVLAKDSRVHSVLVSSEVIERGSAAGVGTTQGFVDENPKATRAILAGLEQAAELIKTQPDRAAEIYLNSEKVKLTKEELVGIINEGAITYDVVPHGVMAYSKFMQQQGMLKTVPGSWQDVFFPLVSDQKGD